MQKFISILILVLIVAVVWFFVGNILMPLLGWIIRIGLTAVLVAVVIYFVRNKGNKI